MKVFAVTWYEKLRKLDYIVLAAALALTVMSLVTLAGAANDIGVKYFYIQLVAAVLGFAMMTVISTVDYEEVADRFSKILFGVSVALLLLTLVIGTGDGNRSWIRFSWLPIGIQPSEFIKVLYIITFSKHISLVRDKINHPLSLLKLGVHAGVIIGLIMLQGDLGSALVYIVMTAAMLFCAGLSFWYFLAAAGALVVLAPFLWEHLAAYQQERIIAGFHPESDPSGKGFQALMSRNAIAAGGFFGTGFSGGTEYLAQKMRGSYASTMCVGVAAVLIAQSAENIGMCLARLPVVGITLPFMSYGGSSMVASYCLIGIIQSINAHRGKYFFERQKK